MVIMTLTMPIQHPEHQYLKLIQELLDDGYDEEGRNGMTRSIFGYSMRFSLNEGNIPFLTTKKLAWKTCFKELVWFLRGSTNNAELVRENVHIWDGNASRDFLDSRGLVSLEEGDLGPIYGHQWRHFNAEYTNHSADYSGKGVDQLQYIITQLKDPISRSSRRLVMTAWNPCQIDQMALPPCHVLIQFNVRQNKYLSCALYQRSGDVGLGVPFNIASYAILTHLIATHCDLVADDFVYYLGNAHIYVNHTDALKEQIKLEPLPFPKIRITQKRENIEDYTLDDIEFIQPYISHPPIKMKMTA